MGVVRQAFAPHIAFGMSYIHLRLEYNRQIGDKMYKTYRALVEKRTIDLVRRPGVLGNPKLRHQLCDRKIHVRLKHFIRNGVLFSYHNIERMRILKDCIAQMNSISTAHQASGGDDAKIKMRGAHIVLLEIHLS